MMTAANTANTANTEKQCLSKMQDDAANTAFLYKNAVCSVSIERENVG